MADEKQNLPVIVEEREEEIKDVLESKIVEAGDNDDRNVLSGAVRKHYTPIIQSMIDAAKGMWVQQRIIHKDKIGDPTGITSMGRVYQRQPNLEIAKYLLNQLIGKPTETQVRLGMPEVINVTWIKSDKSIK